MKLPTNTVRVVLSGQTFQARKDLKRHAYWEASKGRWTIAESQWNLVKHQFPGVYASKVLSGESK